MATKLIAGKRTGAVSNVVNRVSILEFLDHPSDESFGPFRDVVDGN